MLFFCLSVFSVCLGISATIRTRQEIQFLPCAGFLIIHLDLIEIIGLLKELIPVLIKEWSFQSLNTSPNVKTQTLTKILEKESS